jgi:hypothetical protein
MALASGIVFGGFGLMEFYNGIKRLGYFLLPLSVVFIVVGVVYLSIAKRKAQRDPAA